MTECKPVQSWAVTVTINGDEVLTISNSHLSGIENIADYADAVRNCGEHLLAFIGPADQEPFDVDFNDGEQKDDRR